MTEYQEARLAVLERGVTTRKELVTELNDLVELAKQLNNMYEMEFINNMKNIKKSN